MTALAAYGTFLADFPKMLVKENGRYSLIKGYYDYFKHYEHTIGQFTQSHKNFAHTVQAIIEDAVLYIL